MKNRFQLPDMEYSFSIAVVGAESKVNWTGQFKYKRPTLGDRTRIDVMRARLSGDLETVSAEVMDFIEAVSHLRYTLIDYPEWWEATSHGIDMYDGNVVSEIYNKCLAFEAEWVKKIYGGKEDGVKKDGDAPIDGAETPTMAAKQGSDLPGVRA